jgi:hypothetical protein
MEHKIEEFLHAHYEIEMTRYARILLFVITCRINDQGAWAKCIPSFRRK